MLDEHFVRVQQHDFVSAVGSLSERWRFDLDPSLVPIALKDDFYRAALRFSQDDQDIDVTRMGLVGEVGDLAYQLMKMIAVREQILTPEAQRVLSDRYHPYRGPEVLECPSVQLYSDAVREVGDLAGRLASLLPSGTFSAPLEIARDFLASQYIFYMTRQFRDDRKAEGRKDGFQHIDYIVKKVQEETAELVEVLLFQNMPASAVPNLEVLDGRLRSARWIRDEVDNAIYHSCGRLRYHSVFKALQSILRPVQDRDDLQQATEFCLRRVGARYDMTYNGFHIRDVKKVTKVAEYFLEADMVMPRIEDRD